MLMDLVSGKLENSKVMAFQKKLLAWEKTNHRNYPWRDTSNPYRVLIAEIMLQRTGPEQVLPVYTEFLDKYPDVNKLSKADVQDIRQIIISLGLGYRAERIKEISHQIMDKYQGKVPLETEKLLELKGIGIYIAHAVQCLARNKDLTMFDTNSARILGRVFSIDMGRDPHKKRENLETMKKIMPKGQAKKFNLALIDFGSLICTAKNPAHGKCPLNVVCDFYKKSKGAM